MTKKKNKNSIIEIRNLSKIFNIPHEQRSTLAESIIGTITRGKVKYEQLCALRNITLNIKKGEFIGIIGPNGSGKTTLLKIITGILEPERGSVKVIGNVVPFLELGIGFIQDLTAKENIYLYSSLLKLTKKEVDEKFDRIINFAEIKKFIDTPLKDFSTGMLARLAFSIAKEAEGDIYLIDEVLAVGDEEFQKKCISVFDDLKKKGKTVLFVSHSLDMVEKTCHRVIYLDSGKIVKTGSPKTVINTYKKKINRLNQALKIELKKKKQCLEKIKIQGIQINELKNKLNKKAKLQAYVDKLTNNEIKYRTKFCILVRDKNNKLLYENDGKTPCVVRDERGNPLSKYEFFINKKIKSSGEVIIEKVLVLDNKNKKKESFRTGEEFIIRLFYKAKKVIRNPEIGIAIVNKNKIYLAGPNTYHSDRVESLNKGKGYVDYVIKEINLLSGEYKIHASMTRPNKKGAEKGYYFYPNAASFKIKNKNLSKEHGLIELKGDWVYK